jgi:hypothetical protein
MESNLSATLASISDLAIFMDTNCKFLLNDRDLKTNLDAANYAPELSEYINLEQIALGFWFEGCTAKRAWAVTNDAGEEEGSPLISQFKSAAFDYLGHRFEQSRNPLLKARYGLLLWNAPKPYKHIRYIQASLDCLLMALDQTDCTGIYWQQGCIAILNQACAVSTTAKYRKEETITAALDRFTNKTPFDRKGRSHLFKLLTEWPKLFRSNAPSILETTRILFEESYEAEDFSACQHIADHAAPFAQGSNLDVQEWHFRKGKAYEGMARKRLSDENSFVSIDFYTRAAQAYQLAGNEAAERQALQEAQKLKNNLRFKAMPIELPDDFSKKLRDSINQGTKNLLSFDSNTIFDYLARSEEVIPDYAAIKQSVSQLGFSISDMASVLSIDVNKNFQREKSDTTDGVPTEKLRDSYKFALTISLQHLIPLFLDGCRAGKLTFSALQNYLNESSWVAQPLSEHNLDGKKTEYTWQYLVFPALEEFFKQLQLLVQEDQSSQPNFVLCLDSLTLKIEGLLRELLQLKGTTTLATSKKKDLREVYFDDLLNMAIQSKLLNESEAFFFRFVFTPFSQNIRNNIAHSYYHLPDHYSLQNMILVFCALLRLLKFQLIEKPASE